MKRRDFLRRLGLGLAGAWALGRVSWPAGALASDPPVPGLRLAFLADAHLRNADPGHPEARALARAVAELRGLDPAPDLVLFAGDLAHAGDPATLALGKEILSDLPAPLMMVMGEGDGLPDGAAAWRRFFGDPWFSLSIPGKKFSPSPRPSPPSVEREKCSSGHDLTLNLLAKTQDREPETALQILGLHTAWCPGPVGPSFRLGDAGRRWLDRELARLDPEDPLIILSHAPLAPGYRPWGQWTVDGAEVFAQLSRFRQVLCVHGHTHNARVEPRRISAFDEIYFTESRETQTENRFWGLSLPATAWPGPLAVQGTPASLSPGLGPVGCGWELLTLRNTSLTCASHLWQA